MKLVIDNVDIETARDFQQIMVALGHSSARMTFTKLVELGQKAVTVTSKEAPGLTLKGSRSKMEVGVVLN